MAEVERELQSARAESGEWMRSSREAEDRMRAIQKEADSSRKQLLDLVRLCRQQECAHAALKESLQVRDFQQRPASQLPQRAWIFNTCTPFAARHDLAKHAVINFFALAVTGSFTRRYVIVTYKEFAVFICAGIALFPPHIPHPTQKDSFDSPGFHVARDLSRSHLS